jgi:hypothetical protein
MPALVRIVRSIIVLTALPVALSGQAADSAADVPAAAPANVLLGEARRSTGKSFLDHVRTNYAEEPPYSVPATFPGPLVAAPRREPGTLSMLLACLGLLLYLGRRRGKALGIAF